MVLLVVIAYELSVVSAVTP